MAQLYRTGRARTKTPSAGYLRARRWQEAASFVWGVGLVLCVLLRHEDVVWRVVFAIACVAAVTRLGLMIAVQLDAGRRRRASFHVPPEDQTIRVALSD